MRGHTSDNILAACLAKMILMSGQEAKQRVDETDASYFNGKADACREIAILLAVNDKVDAILKRANETES